MSVAGQSRRFGRVPMPSGLPLQTDIVTVRRDVSNVPIVLKKSFWGDERNFLELLIRFERGDVRDHIDSSKIDLGPS